MKHEVSVITGVPERNFDLGTWLGRRQAFSMMAGKATAADVECLRTIRDERLYKAKSDRWGDFCSQYVGASKTQVDRLIRYLEEFGPQFFEITNVARITPETYRLIAKHVSAEGLKVDDQVIPIAQENSARVSAGIATLRKRLEPPKAPPRRVTAIDSDAHHTVVRAWAECCYEELIRALKEVDSLTPDEQRGFGILQFDVGEQEYRLGVHFPETNRYRA